MRHPFPRRREIMLRGTDETRGSFFSYVDFVDRIPARHSLRRIRQVVNDALARVDTDFGSLYVPSRSPFDCPGAADPGQLAPDPLFGPLRWQLMEQMQYKDVDRFI